MYQKGVGHSEHIWVKICARLYFQFEGWRSLASWTSVIKNIGMFLNNGGFLSSYYIKIGKDTSSFANHCILIVFSFSLYASIDRSNQNLHWWWLASVFSVHWKEPLDSDHQGI